MSTAVLYWWCHSDSASVLVVFFFFTLYLTICEYREDQYERIHLCRKGLIENTHYTNTHGPQLSISPVCQRGQVDIFSMT